MTILRHMIPWVAVALAPLALAEPAVDGESLGRLQSALDFCTQHNPPAAMWYRDQAKQSLNGATAQEVAAARQSGDYRATYEANRAALDALSKEDATAACDSNWQAGNSEQATTPPDDKSQAADGGST